MFLLLGTRLSQTVINLVQFVCSNCGVNAQQRVIKQSNKFTLFFVPLFSVSTSYLNECSNCGYATALSPEQAQHSVEWARTHNAGGV